MKVAYFFIFGLFYSAFAFKFEDAKQVGVEFGAQTSTSQTITVDEGSGEESVKIVLVTEVKGELTINPLVNGGLLNIAKEQGSDDTQWYISINRLDYEKLVSENIGKNFPVDVIENNDISSRQTLNVIIKNLDDESPTLLVTPCTMKENTLVTADISECKFSVSDLDGILNKMNYYIVGTENEADIFDFKYKDDPGENLRTTEVYLVLKDGITLDYEQTTFYTFHVNATDGAGHPTIPLSSTPITIEVIDVADVPPQWNNNFNPDGTRIVIVAEETDFIGDFSATDGDRGINSPITYTLFDSSGYVSIDENTGEINIKAIDRDSNNLTQIDFNITATETLDSNMSVSGFVTVIIEDIDDNIASITVGEGQREINITIDEGSTELPKVEISISDIDLNENAVYDVILESNGSVDFTTVFSVSPSRGHATTEFSLVILDPSKLDYEEKEWQVITMKMKTIGIENNSMIDVIPITIYLSDVNDEKPQFENNDYKINVPEDVDVGTVLTQIKASDRDAEDENLKYELVGVLANVILNIDESNGNITTKIADAFDYEKQQEIVAKIRVTDNADHQTTAQLTILIEDVNDESPRLAMTGSIQLEENQEEGISLETNIFASDEDSNPYLNFSIDWSKSYATKNLQRLNETIFETIQFIEIDTVRNDTTNQIVTAQLTITKNILDFETVDNLYLQLVVEDLNTEKGINSDSALIVIGIGDINDNAPVFSEDIETRVIKVTENSPNGTLITAIVATDSDIQDILTYSIKSEDEDTPMWVAIDDTGSISVFLANDDDKIDCDDPIRWNLTYIVTVTDNVHETTATVTINIDDENDNQPELDEGISGETSELENGSHVDNDTPIITLNATDKDRDETFNSILCQFAEDTPLEVKERFKIENNSVYVSLIEGVNLDREETDTWTWTISCIDNPSQTGSITNMINRTVTLILTDINDNPPVINKTEIDGIFENQTKDSVITLEGFDPDSGANSLINYIEITKVIRYIDEPDDSEDLPLDIFSLTTSDDNITGNLILNKDSLQNFYGYLVLTISLTDLGDEPLTNTVDVTLNVGKFNFEDPEFIYPEGENEKIFLQVVQNENTPLKLYNGVDMQNIEATDNQGNKFDFSFEIVEDTSQDKIFLIENIGDFQGQLQLNVNTSTQLENCNITVQATVNGNPPTSASLSKNITININFFDVNHTAPTFSKLNGTTEVEENTAPKLIYALDAATSPEGLPENLTIYYELIQGDDTLFQFDKTNMSLMLIKPLDYDNLETQEYNLIIQASYLESSEKTNFTDDKFYLTVGVTDINDNPPAFDDELYNVTLNVTYSRGEIIFQLNAVDIDSTSEGKLRYYMIDFTTSDPSLDTIHVPVIVGESDGFVKVNFAPDSAYKGYFSIEFIVQDESDDEAHMSTTTLQVNLPAESASLETNKLLQRFG